MLIVRFGVHPLPTTCYLGSLVSCAKCVRAHWIPTQPCEREGRFLVDPGWLCAHCVATQLDMLNTYPTLREGGQVFKLNPGGMAGARQPNVW